MPKLPPKPAPDLTTPQGLHKAILDWYNKLDPVLIYELKEAKVKEQHIKFAIGFLLTHDAVLTLKTLGFQGKEKNLWSAAHSRLKAKKVQLALTKLKPVLHAKRGTATWLKQKLEEIVEYCPAWEHKVKAAEIYAKILGLVKRKAEEDKKEKKFRGVVLTPPPQVEEEK